MAMRFKSIRTRLMMWFLVVALLPLFVAGVILYDHKVGLLKSEAFDKLSTIRNLKVGEINSWIDERTGDIKIISRIAEIQDSDSLLHSNAGAGKRAETLNLLSDILLGIQESCRDYDGLFIIDAHSGRVVVSTDPSQVGKDLSADRQLTEPLRTKETYISDIYESKPTNRPTMVFSNPIHDRRHNNPSPWGVLVARINLEDSIYQLLLNRTGLGNTGETLIVNKDIMALSELRWYGKAPLKLKIKGVPAILASEGKTGVLETTDYRGEKVLAAHTYIPRTRWGFVAKMDQKEVYAPIRELFLMMVLLFFFTAAAVYLISFLLARRTAQPILGIAAVAKRIREGDLAARNTVSSEDEIGYLADSFNRTADSIALRIETERSNADIAETLILPKNLQTFSRAVLEKLMETTESQLGAFYIRRADDSLFEPLAAIGVTPELLQTFDAAILEGEFGKALATGRMSHIRSISEETRFRFKTFAGTAIPREMITLPVVVKDEVRAMISLASLGVYSESALSILNQPAIIALNSAFANLLANEETRRLAEDLREANQELQAQQEELQAQAEELQKQSEELLGQNVELDRQRLSLEEASRLKSQFLSNMSHELRTPLNSVMALSRVLIMQTKNKLSEEEVNYLEIIERNGKNLLTLINEILDLSKIEAGRMDVNPKSFSLRPTLENIIESLSPLATEKRIELHQEISADLPLLESDEIRVSQILQNLMANAVKFTETGGVTVAAESDPEKVTVRVTDTGIGIAENDLPYIFDEFRQVDGTSSRRYEGTGLGLAIARKMAGMLGGDITVQSIPGRGSTFMLTLPLAWHGQASACEPIVTRLRQPVVKSAHKTILVVDDEPEMAAMISRNLLQEGYNTVTATSGSEALALAARERPFAVTLDIMMPDMDGWEVLQGLKNNPETKDIPVIIVSMSEDRETGFALGAVGYVTKPVSKEQLISEIRRVGKPGTRAIMIVDDNALERKEIGRLIEEEGLKPIAAGDGAACLELIQKQVPDVLVLDLMMPELDGFAVLERIRSNPVTEDLPVIIVTAKDLTEEDRTRLSGNVSSVLQKSATTSVTLLTEIKSILEDLEGRPKPAGPQKSAAPLILLVEDNEAAIIQVRAVLETAGYAVDVARGGQEAFDYVSHTVPDGIVLDLMMPEIDGFSVLDKIRGTKVTATLPVLILTAKDLTQEDLSKLSANHIQQLVQKGDVDRERLLSKIRSMLGGGSGPRAWLNEGAAGKTASSPDNSGDRPAVQPRPVDRRKETALPPDAVSADVPLETADRTGSPVILIVEDNPDNMTTIKAVLRNRYRIMEATDGEEGLRLAQETLPDLILLDMSLPKMDGLTVVRQLKDNPALRSILVVAMTARVMKGDREKILDAGCDDYIAKPIDPEGFLKKIDGWLIKG